jgi:hypothetical protein
MNGTQRILLVAALLAPAAVVSAHHSYAAVDVTRRATVEGTVKTLEWTNPHVWVWMVGDDGNGRTLTYAFESQAPSELARFFGWHKRILNAGDRVTVEYAPFKNGDHGGALRQITFPDGRVLVTANTNRGSGGPAAGPGPSSPSRQAK